MWRRPPRTTLSVIPDLKEPIMFPSSSLHTDFARQLQADRFAESRILRGASRESGRRFASLTAALLKRLRHATPAAPVADAEPVAI
jgi:hypothetical protein